MERLKKLPAFMPLLAGSLWSAAGLFAGGPDGWAMLMTLTGILILTLWLPGKSAGILTAGGLSLLAAGLLLACCLYASEAPAKPQDLTEVRGTVSSVRAVSASRFSRTDYQVTLEGGGGTCRLSGVRWGGGRLPLKAGDRVRLLCAGDRGSVYELEINGETVMSYETACVRTEENRSLLWAVGLLVPGGLGLGVLNGAGKRAKQKQR